MILKRSSKKVKQPDAKATKTKTAPTKVQATKVASTKTRKATPKKAEKSATANIRYIHMAPRKIRRIVDLVRTLSVTEAEHVLGILPKRATIPVKKAIQSAAANAVNNYQMDRKRLVINKITVGQSLSLSRFRPRAQGRAFPIHKHFAHINVTLVERTEQEQKRAETTKAKTKTKAARKTEAPEAPRRSAPVISATKIK